MTKLTLQISENGLCKIKCGGKPNYLLEKNKIKFLAGTCLKNGLKILSLIKFKVSYLTKDTMKAIKYL